MKPQLKFKHKVDNSALIPFIPKIRGKPNAITPLPSKFFKVFLWMLKGRMFSNDDTDGFRTN